MLELRTLRRSWPQALIALLALAVDMPALASSGSGVAIPDPSATTLLALGVLGVIVGRYGGKRPPLD